MPAQPAAPSSPAMTATLYALVVLIWGSTWIALKLQLGTVPVELSIAYRFALAAVLMFAWLAWSRLIAWCLVPRLAWLATGQGAWVAW